MAKNPNWSRDELILALDLYFSEGRKQLEPSHTKVIELSDLLNKLPIYSVELREAKFRNPTGISMKLANFLRLDPHYTGVGLERGSKLEQEVWDEFADEPYQLRQVANAIRRTHVSIAESVTSYEVNVEEEFAEGKILTRVHKQRERSPKLVKRKKEAVLKKEGKLVCQVCDFDFATVYGELGMGFAECHHLVPLSELSTNQKTKLSDLAIVCSNCHRMLHRRKSLLSISELRQIVLTRRE